MAHACMHAWPCSGSPPSADVYSARRGAGRQVEHHAVKRNSIFFFKSPYAIFAPHHTDASLAPANFAPIPFAQQMTRKSPLPCFVSREK